MDVFSLCVCGKVSSGDVVCVVMLLLFFGEEGSVYRWVEWGLVCMLGFGFVEFFVLGGEIGREGELILIICKECIND